MFRVRASIQHSQVQNASGVCLMCLQTSRETGEAEVQ